MQAILSNPGLLIALCVIVAIVVGVNATLVSLLRRRPGPDEAGQWSRALGGPRAQQRQQSAQLDELHRIVTELAADQPTPEKPNE